MNGTTLTFKPYPEMVRSLFKPMGSTQANLLHAAAGIAGESGELSLVNSIEDLVLEMGDVHFYVEAMYQQLGGRQAGLVRLEADDPCAFQVVATAPTALMTLALGLLDECKKCWVYGKSWDELDLRRRLMRVEVVLDGICQLHGVRLSDVLKANQYKLAKRFPGQVYQDAAAIARADEPARPGDSDVQTSEHDGSSGATNPG